MLHEQEDNHIYKVNHIVNNKIVTIFVFAGSNKETILEPYFSKQEIENIQSEKIKVIFSLQQIHFDDTIGTIKIKILNELKSKVSLEEIYLFCQKLESLNSVSIYQSLTQNRKIELTNIRLQQFLSNIVSNKSGTPLPKLEEKDTYTYDDILDLKLESQPYIINKVLGQKFFIVENEYPFVCNPFTAKKYDTFFERHARKSLSTLNSHLLLNAGSILNNNIYLCLAKDVLEYADKSQLSTETTLKIYYPFLYDKNINELEDLEKAQPGLIEMNKTKITDKTHEIFETIDMFYDVYKLRKDELDYVSKGIKYIKAILKPEFDIKIPLEVIFKILHANINNPLIKYNPSVRQENVYRLYTGDSISTDGRKIPYLKKAVIFKLIKNIAKSKSVAVYIEYKDKDKVQILICEFDENGYITISSEFDNIVSKENIDQLFRDSINPIIREIQNLLSQSGYKLNEFSRLTDQNIEIKQITYETQIEIKKTFNITSFQGCISSIFNVESNSSTKGIQLRYKRVANFSKVTSQEAFIIEKSDQGLRGGEIIEALLENFPDDLDRKGAEELLRKVANEIQLEKGVRKSEIKIKDNPGFKTIIKVEKSGIVTITMENINDIYYLSTIPIYLDTVVRLTQNKSSTKYPIKQINKLCSGEIKEDIDIPDIISSSESPVSENEVPSIEDAEDIEYEKYISIRDEKPKGAFDLFFGDDYDEDEEDFEGGKTNKELSESSESSISSIPTIPSEQDKLSSLKEGKEGKEEEESSISSIPSIKSEILPSQVQEKKTSSSEESSVTSESKKLSSPKSVSPLQQVVNFTKNTIMAPISEVIQKTVKPEEDIQEIEKKVSIQVSEPEKQEKEPEPEPEPEQEPEPEPEPESKDESDQKVNEEPEEPEEENEVKNIDGLKLNKPYYFQSLIENKDPVLIIKEDTREYNAYSRTCSSDTRRQPVILTDKQLENIKKEHPNFLRDEDVIKYGSNPKNKFNYICPRYWCIKNNTIIDPKDLKEVIGKDGKKELVHPTCGKVIPRGDKAVKPGYYIYEFYKEDENKRYPGFQTGKHPAGYCLPCCFDKYNTQGRIAAKKQCYDSNEEDEDEEDEDKEKTQRNKQEQQETQEGKQVEKIKNKPIEEKQVDQDEYIKGPDKFPLLPGKWGYLPMGIEKMLNEVNADCQISKTNTNIKHNHPCLLRHGIEVNKNQSFISCISDFLFFGKRLIDENGKITDRPAKILPIKEMKDLIIKSLTIDNFISFQNGNLVSNFYNNNNNNNNNNQVDINKYNKSILYSKLNMDKKEDKSYYTRVVSSFENFIFYLRDNDTIIDHTYLWDIISMPNKYLFKDGVNLVIFQLPNNDITNNVELLCPTNHYSSQFYEARKPTIIMMKEDGYYEPIYSYTISDKKLTVAKEFKEYDPYLSKSIKNVIKQIIKPFFSTMCKPLDSMPNLYKAKRSLLLHDLKQKLSKYDYDVLKEVINFNNKVIGVLAQDPEGRKGFIPCYPSSIAETSKEESDYFLMTDLRLWTSYSELITFLTKLHKKSKKRKEDADIPCKPAFKIVEDEMVVGILTETNQFIQLSEPISEVEIEPDQNIPTINNANYIVDRNKKPMVPIDVPITTQNDIDEERVDYIKRIKMETNFYNVFRNTIRILVNDYENVKLREKIEGETTKEFLIYSEKLKNVDRMLK